MRSILEQLRSDLAQIAGDTTGLTDTVTLDQTAVGRVSRVDALQAQAVAIAARDRAKARLKAVERAIERLDDNPDGFDECPDCGEAIGFGRLRASPETPFCVGCLAERGG